VIRDIIFDFDGVILDSISIKTEAFRKIFNDFPKEKVDQLIDFHINNGGMSRYLKIKYFFEEILNIDIDKEKIARYAKRYSQLTKERLANRDYLIDDSIEFIEQNYKKYNIYIASGADENDLLYICDKLEIKKYFKSIKGSPKAKDEIVKDIIKKNSCNKSETILIGDSINDYKAAKANAIEFYGYNNEDLRKYGNYLEKIQEINWIQ